MERHKISLQDIADRAALKLSTLKRVMNGSYQYDEASMRSIRFIEAKMTGKTLPAKSPPPMASPPSFAPSL